MYQPSKELQVTEGIFKTKIKGLWYIERKQHDDQRGFFAEIGYVERLEKLLGREFCIKQINHSRSDEKVVRGMHAEGWNKLVAVINGVSFCALADVRPESETFCQTVCFRLGFGEGVLKGGLLIEQGIANSICVVKGPVDYVYCVDRLYRDRDKKGDTAISLFDQDLKIDWPIKKEEMIISERDRAALSLREMFADKF